MSEAVHLLSPNGRLGARVAALRQAKALRVEKVAGDIGVSYQTIYNIEAGHGCRTDTVVRLADYLGVSLDYLFGCSERKARLAPPAPG